jgi:hypothetical protein
VKYIYIFIITILANVCVAQETVERSRKLTPEVVEKYQVLKSDYAIMHGQYAAYLKKTLLAAGRYNKNKKIGTWTFFDKTGKVCQRFSYDKNTLLYEIPRDSASKITYMVDDSLKNDPRFTRPIKIGGLYFGFLKYVNVIKLPAGLENLSNNDYKVFMEILVSPFGRLAEYKLHIAPKVVLDPTDHQFLNVNLNLLDEEDKIFLPATLDNKSVAVRMIIPCTFYKSNLIRL